MFEMFANAFAGLHPQQTFVALISVALSSFLKASDHFPYEITSFCSILYVFVFSQIYALRL